ncbi:MAG: hypothetical protein WC459_02055 [Patescibacteria group bacterium]
MAEKIRSLQPLSFDNKKAQDYGRALNGEYRDYNFGFSLGISTMLAITGGSVGGACISGCLFSESFVAIEAVLFWAVVCAAIAFSSFFIPYNYLRTRGARRVLNDREAAYLFDLKRAVDEYNKQAENFNGHLSANRDNPQKLENLKEYYKALKAVQKGLEKRIGVEARKELPALNMMRVWQNEINLSRHNPKMIAPPSENLMLPESSNEHEKILAELDAEFSADKD